MSEVVRAEYIEADDLGTLKIRSYWNVTGHERPDSVVHQTLVHAFRVTPRHVIYRDFGIFEQNDPTTFRQRLSERAIPELTRGAYYASLARDGLHMAVPLNRRKTLLALVGRRETEPRFGHYEPVCGNNYASLRTEYQPPALDDPRLEKLYRYLLRRVRL